MATIANPCAYAHVYVKKRQTSNVRHDSQIQFCKTHAQSVGESIRANFNNPPLALESRTVSAPTFEDVILPHLDEAYNLARWLMRDPPDAEDVVQDACVRALQYFASFRGDNGKAWLLRIVRNTAFAKLKDRKAAAEISLQIPCENAGEDTIALRVVDPAPGPEAALAENQKIARVRAALAALPIDLRECIVLREMDGLSYRAIAGITDVSIGTVMSRLYRARRALAKTWTEIAK